MSGTSVTALLSIIFQLKIYLPKSMRQVLIIILQSVIGLNYCQELLTTILF